jgi:Leucine-rich repeat (LRR) protein
MCDVSSECSVRSVNLYGSPIPSNIDSWQEVETLNLCFAGVKNLDSICQLSNLRRLYLRYNNIESFEEIKKLKDLPELTSLSLIGNDICAHPDYR